MNDDQGSISASNKSWGSPLASYLPNGTDSAQAVSHRCAVSIFQGCFVFQGTEVMQSLIPTLFAGLQQN